MKILKPEQRFFALRKCERGKHKFRTNGFGVTWCVYCGCLSNADSELLTEDDKVLYIS